MVKIKKVISILTVLAMAIVYMPSGGSVAASGTLARISLSSSGVQGNGESLHSSMSLDGRYVVFDSEAGNLVANDGNSTQDVFLYDRQSGSIRLISAASNGQPGNGSSSSPVISSDGRYIAFESEASNLITGDDNNESDIFLYDITNGTLKNITKGATGTSNAPAISGNGRIIAFLSTASNLDGEKSNDYGDIYVYNQDTNIVKRITRALDGDEANGESSEPAVSSDGNYIAFTSEADNIIVEDTNESSDIFVYNMQNGQNERISINSSGEEGIDNSGKPSISGDGRYIAFVSIANNLVSGDGNLKQDVFVRDRQNGTTELISITSLRRSGNDEGDSPSISVDGRYVAFSSLASNLTPNDRNGRGDIFLRDRTSGSTGIMSISDGGIQGNDNSMYPCISPDGRYISFNSDSTNLVGGDTNSKGDIFVGSTMAAPGDLAAPTWPSGAKLTTTNVTSNSMTLAWIGAADDTGIAGYNIYKGETQIGNTGGNTTSYNVTGLVANTSYLFKVRAIDTAGKMTASPITVTAVTAKQVPDKSVPVWPSGSRLTLSEVRDTSIKLNWTAATDNVGIYGYVIYRDNIPVNTVNGNIREYIVNNLMPNTRYNFKVEASDQAGNTTHNGPSASGTTTLPTQSSNEDWANIETKFIAEVIVNSQIGGALYHTPKMSYDGRYIVFNSNASNIVSGDTNNCSDIFVFDRSTETIKRISVSNSGVQAGNHCGWPAISGDGRYIAFSTEASNLAEGGESHKSGIYLYDMQTNQIKRVTDGTGYYARPSINQDGRYIVYSKETGSSKGDNNNKWDIYLYDQSTGVTELVSVSAAGGPGNGNSGMSGNIGISSDGRFISFGSSSSNLVPNDNNNHVDIFIRDMREKITERIDKSWRGEEGNLDCSYHCDMSMDGRYIVYTSLATNLVTDDNNNAMDVFLYDRQSNFTRIVSCSNTFVLGNSTSYSPYISGDGKYVLFTSSANNFMEGDRAYANVYLYDTQSLEIDVMDISSSRVVGNRDGDFGYLAKDGRTVAFLSSSTNLVEGSDLRSDVYSLFIHDTSKRRATSPPNWPNGSGIRASNITNNGYRLTWTAAVDDYGVTRYEIYMDGIGFDCVDGNTTSYEVTNEPMERTFKIVALDMNGNRTDLRTAPTLTINPGNNNRDNISPTWPEGSSITASSITNTSITLNWTAAVDNIDVKEYWIYKDHALVSKVKSGTRTFNATGLNQGITYEFQVKAADAAGNVSHDGLELRETTNNTSNNNISSEDRTVMLTCGINGVPSNDDSYNQVMSADGRYLAFTSWASNLVPNDNNNTSDVFLYDMQTSLVKRISVSASGREGNGPSDMPFISTDGRYVAFSSYAGNLTQNDTNLSQDVFLYDTQTPLLIRVTDAEWDSCALGISDDGRYILYNSKSDWLINNINLGKYDIYIYDVTTGRSELISASNDGAAANASSIFGDISSDGRYVCFESSADNLMAAGENNGGYNVYIRDMVNKTTECISKGSNNIQGNGNCMGWPRMSNDGRYVVYSSTSSNLVDNDSNGNTVDIFVYDKQSKTNEIVSVSSYGIQSNGKSNFPYISSDGRYVSFSSEATNLLRNPVQGKHLYIHDRVTKKTVIADVSNLGEPGRQDRFEPLCILYDNGNRMILSSDAANLVDNDTNSCRDLFICSISYEENDISKPVWPASKSLRALNTSCYEVELGWSCAMDNTGVFKYNIYHEQVFLGSVDGYTTSYRVEGLNPGVKYNFRVEAEDYTGNISTDGPRVSITTLQEPAFRSISIPSGTTIRLKTGETRKINVMALPVKGKAIDISRRASYTSSDVQVAAVGKGSIVGIRPGNAKITIKYKNYSLIVNVLVE